MSDTVMLVIGGVAWTVVLWLVWFWVTAESRRSDIEKVRDELHDWVAAQNIGTQKKVEARIIENERDLSQIAGETAKLWERIEEEYGNSCAMGERLTSLISDLNLRVARAEATIAATPTPPDPATIIAAATAPLLALTEQYTSPHQFPAPVNVAGGVEDGEWTAEELAAYDPTDEDFPPYRAPDDYSPPAGFSGLGIDLPRLDG